MISIFDNYHLSSLDRSFSSHLYHMHTKIREILSLVFNQIYFQIFNRQIFQFTIPVLIGTIQKPDSTSMRFFFLIIVCLSRYWSFLWAYFCFHIQDPSSCNFNFNQAIKFLVSHAHIFSLHLYNDITNNS
jgi:hypothetical protein